MNDYNETLRIPKLLRTLEAWEAGHKPQIVEFYRVEHPGRGSPSRTMGM